MFEYRHLPKQVNLLINTEISKIEKSSPTDVKQISLICTKYILIYKIKFKIKLASNKTYSNESQVYGTLAIVELKLERQVVHDPLKSTILKETSRAQIWSKGTTRL